MGGKAVSSRSRREVAQLPPGRCRCGKRTRPGRERYLAGVLTCDRCAREADTAGDTSSGEHAESP